MVYLLAAAMGVTGSLAQNPQPRPLTPAAPPSTESSVPEQQSHQLSPADMEAFFDGVIPYQLAREDIAGAVVAVVKDGKVLFAKGYGYANVKSRVPVSPTSTLFRVGSISKTFTWTAVMQLVEQGKIDLDADVNSYLDFQIPHTFGRPVTVRNLMTHTPGFEEVVKDLIVDHADELPSLQAYVSTHRPNQIFTPGTVPAYSNYGAVLAGYIVQRVSGVPFEEYVDRNIFQPLGITHATFLQPLPDRLKPMMSNGYGQASEDPKPFELGSPEPDPAGSLSITAADMAPFMIAHLQNGKYGDVRILQPLTIEMMHARQFLMDPAVNGATLGFWEGNRNGLRIIGHGGDLQYFHSDMELIPSEGLGFFVSYNSLGKGELDVREWLWYKFLDRYFPFQEPPRKTVADVDSVSGKYLASRRAQTTILRALWWVLAESSVSDAADATIQVDQMKDPSGNPKRWRGIGNLTFRELGGQQVLVFKRDTLGQMQMITDDPIDIYQRVPWYLSKSLLQIALGFTVLLFALTLILWPIAALVRRHYKRPLTLEPTDRRLRLFVKLACAVELGALVAFAAIIAYGFSNLALFSERLDPWLRLLQVAMNLGIIGTCLIVYNGYRAWRTEGAGLWTKIYASGLVLASLFYACFVIASRLLNSSLNY
jgi:CubicO group peptidase (beta-lactamase class C family)